jgi:hypothetical protein
MNIQETSRFSLFLQNAENDTHDKMARAPADQHRPSDEEQGSPQEDTWLRAMWNSYAYRSTVTTVPRSSIGPTPSRDTCSHTLTTSWILAVAGKVLDLTAQDKEPPPLQGAMEHSPASEDPPVEEAKAEMVSPGKGKRQGLNRTQNKRKSMAWRSTPGMQMA